MMKYIAAFAVLSVLGLAVPAYASPENVNVTGYLTIGGAFAGNITYDPTTGIVSGGAFDMYEQLGGGGYTGFDFEYYTASTKTAVFAVESFGGPPPSEVDQFMMIFSVQGASPTMSNASFEDIIAYGYQLAGTKNTVTSSTLTPPAPKVAATPEPSSFVLLGTGVLGVAGAARRRLFKR